MEENFKDFRNRMAETMATMSDYGILKQIEGDFKETEFGLEPGYQLSPIFNEKLMEHYTIQSSIERSDQGKVQTIMGNLSRDQYIIGITLSDILELSPKDCEKCIFIATKTSKFNEGGKEILLEHLKTDHPEYFERQEKFDKEISGWISIIENWMRISSRHKKWRSNS